MEGADWTDKGGSLVMEGADCTDKGGDGGGRL